MKVGSFPCLLLALTTSACGPCSGTDVGNGRTTVELNVKGYEAVAASAQAMTLTSGTRIDELYLVIGRVRLQPGEGCEGEDDGAIDVDGPLVADLVGDKFVAGAVRFDTVAGSFCKLRFDFQKLGDGSPAAAPAALAGLSMLVTGTRSDGVPFTIRSDRTEQVELGAQNAFSLGEGENDLFLGYEVSSWIDAAALDELDGNPIVVDKDNNPDRLEAFEEAVKASSRLFGDGDGDGELGDDEHDDDDSLAD
jgi:hypothetical protein